MRRPKIILVEDDDATLQAFAEALREDFAVWVARNGTHAMEVAEELGWDADVLVVDITLGEGPRGDQFVAYYRTRARREVPVVVVSGAPRAGEIARALGTSATLFKPVDIERLRRTIRSFTEKTDRSDEAAE